MGQARRDPRMLLDDAEPVFAGNRLIASGFLPIHCAWEHATGKEPT